MAASSLTGAFSWPPALKGYELCCAPLEQHWLVPELWLPDEEGDRDAAGGGAKTLLSGCGSEGLRLRLSSADVEFEN